MYTLVPHCSCAYYWYRRGNRKYAVNYVVRT